MCLINFQYERHPNYKLIIAANRDEFYERPTAQAHFWKDHPQVLAGRDLHGMGTWLGITKQGRFAALTNIRNPEEDVSDKKSRGDILKNYLAGTEPAESFVENLKKEKNQYASFNLLVGNLDQLLYFNSKQGEIEKVEAGTHGLSNHFLNTPWPKVEKGKQMMESYVAGREKVEPEQLFEILTMADIAADGDLPNTGVGVELEKQLSPLFIKMENYGTRSSTVLLVDRDDNVTFVERTYQKGEYHGEAKFTFQIED